MNGEKIGSKLRKAREYLELTQEEVADIIGLGRDAIIRIEKGTRKVSTEELARFSKLYMLSTDELLNNDKNIDYSVQAFARGFEKLSDKDKNEIINLIKFKNEIKEKGNIS